MSSGGLPYTQETGEGDHLSEANLETEASGGGSGDAASGAGAGAGAVVEGGQVVSDCCKWCEASPVVLGCSKCQLVKYCNQDCQRQDWKKHKPRCKEEQVRRKGLNEELWMASCRGDVRAMNELAAQGADINYVWVEHDCNTPLMAAVTMARFASIDALIVTGVRVHDVDALGFSALCTACQFGNDKDSQDQARQAGMTSESTSLRMVNALIAAGANVHQVTSTSGSSPLTLASEQDHPSVVDPLMKAGANVHYARPDGGTALTTASLFGRVETVRLLLAADVDPSISDQSVRTALALAKQLNHTAVVALLEARLAELTGSG